MSKVTEWANVAEGVEAGQLLLKDEARRHDRRRLPRCSHDPVTSPHVRHVLTRGLRGARHFTENWELWVGGWIIMLLFRFFWKCGCLSFFFSWGSNSTFILIHHHNLNRYMLQFHFVLPQYCWIRNLYSEDQNKKLTSPQPYPPPACFTVHLQRWSRDRHDIAGFARWSGLCRGVWRDLTRVFPLWRWLPVCGGECHVLFASSNIFFEYGCHFQ